MSETYRETEQQLIMPDDFFLPFGGQLNKDNRWVKMAALIPWWKVEQVYAKRFEKKIKEDVLYPFGWLSALRMALGALIIKRTAGHE